MRSMSSAVAGAGPRLLAILAALSLAAGCSDAPVSPARSHSSGIDPAPTGLIVSNPVPAPAAPGRAHGALAVDSAADVVYVAATPGTAPTGRLATVQRPGDVGSLTTAVVDGGFDPVPVAAQAGDSIEVTVTDAADSVVLHTTQLVALRRAPTVVRTDPPAQKRDVPLNANLVIVFSEPVDSTSLTPSTVRLLHGTTVIRGTVSLLAGTATAAVFTPGAALDPNTDYQLVVTRSVRDVGGDALEAGVTVGFTTGSVAAGVPVQVMVVPDSATVYLHGNLQLWVDTVRDAGGNLLSGLPITWASVDPSVATVDSTGLVTGIDAGSTRVTATVQGVSGSSAIVVSSSLPPPPAAVHVYPEDTTALLVGDALWLLAVANDSSGFGIPGLPIAWASGDSTVATVSASGLVIARAPGLATLTATMDGVSGSTTVRISVMRLTPSLPYAVVIGGADTVDFTADLAASLSKAGLTWTVAGPGCGGSACGALSASRSASGESVRYTAPSIVPSPSYVIVTAASLADPGVFAFDTVPINSTVQVSVAPTLAGTDPGVQRQFVASESGDPNNAGVRWSVSGPGCTATGCGTITAGGLYTAPSAVPNPAAVTVTATSVTDYNQSASAQVLVTTPGEVSVVVVPHSTSVCSPPTFSCRPPYKQLTAYVFNDPSNAGVTWSTPVGSISPVSSASGTPVTYTPASMVCTTTVARATSVADPTSADSAIVTLRHPGC